MPIIHEEPEGHAVLEMTAYPKNRLEKCGFSYTVYMYST